MRSVERPIKVLLADDHSLFRMGMRRILAATDDLEVVGEVGTGPEVLEFVAAHPVDVLVLDLSLPGMSGVEVVRRLDEVAPRVTVVILTMYPESLFALHLVRQGAGAYITKDASSDELLAAIRAVVGGGTYLTPALQRRATQGSRAAASALAPHERLSTREFQVFLRLIEGKTVSETAGELDLTVSTVSTYVSGIRTKLECGSIGDVVRYAARAGLLP